MRPRRWWEAHLVRYQPPPGASPRHRAADSLRLAPGGSLSCGLALAQPPFLLIQPGRQVGAGDKDGGLGGSGVGALSLPAPGQDRNMEWRRRTVGQCQPRPCRGNHQGSKGRAGHPRSWEVGVGHRACFSGSRPLLATLHRWFCPGRLRA